MCRQNAVARYQNRNRIRPARAADSANGFGLANRLRDFTVGFRLASGNLPQRVPDLSLKFRSAAQIQRREIFRRTPGQRILERCRRFAVRTENGGRNL